MLPKEPEREGWEVSFKRRDLLKNPKERDLRFSVQQRQARERAAHERSRVRLFRIPTGFPQKPSSGQRGHEA